MLKKLRQSIKHFIRNIYIEALREAKDEIHNNNIRAEIEKSRLKPHAKDIVEQIFDGDFTWFDWNEGAIETRRQYYNEAQQILNSDIFNNIQNYLIATGSKTAVLQSDPNSGAIRDFQMTVNGMKLLKEELEGIVNPDRQNIYADQDNKKKPSI